MLPEPDDDSDSFHHWWFGHSRCDVNAEKHYVAEKNVDTCYRQTGSEELDTLPLSPGTAVRYVIYR